MHLLACISTKIAGNCAVSCTLLAAKLTANINLCKLSLAFIHIRQDTKKCANKYVKWQHAVISSSAAQIYQHAGALFVSLMPHLHHWTGSYTITDNDFNSVSSSRLLLYLDYLKLPSLIKFPHDQAWSASHSCPRTDVLGHCGTSFFHCP